ncbi:MAG: hypothetical protein KJ941_08530 [Bacteroidetes bacterium]|nr:hypothetical protein [Bacteroidota bacterium]
MRRLIIYFVLLSNFGFGQTNDDLRKEENVLTNASSLQLIFGYQYSSIVKANGTSSPWKEYIEENKNSLRFSDHEFYLRYALINLQRFNFQIGACLGFSNYLLVDYYSSMMIDSVEYQMANPSNEQYLFKRLGLSYEVDLLVGKGVKGNHGFFVQGDVSYKINSPGQRSMSDQPNNTEASSFYSSTNGEATFSNQLPDGKSWNKISLGYQITRQVSPFSDAQLKLSYGLLWGDNNPFAGSQIYSIGMAVDFGRRKPSKKLFEQKEKKYDFKVNRSKYE